MLVVLHNEGFIMFDDMPAWLPDVGSSSLISLFGYALSKSWLYTKRQVDEIIGLLKENSAIWKEVAKTNQDIIYVKLNQLDLVVSAVADILKIVEELLRHSYYNNPPPPRRKVN